MNLDTRNRLMHLVKLYQGSVNSSQVRVAEVYKQAITDNSPTIILSHNHPSGALRPSEADIGLTKKLTQAAESLDILVLDHLIVSENGYYSFAD